jgi:hypothetical protein
MFDTGQFEWGGEVCRHGGDSWTSVLSFGSSLEIAQGFPVPINRQELSAPPEDARKSERERPVAGADIGPRSPGVPGNGPLEQVDSVTDVHEASGSPGCYGRPLQVGRSGRPLPAGGLHPAIALCVFFLMPSSIKLGIDVTPRVRQLLSD